MQYLIVISLIAAVASAGYLKPTAANAELAQIQEIIEAINSPSTDPATAAALEQMLFETLGVAQQPAPVDISPILIDFPLPDGGAVSADALPAPETPAVVAEAAPVAVAPEAPAAATSPLVQIIVNVNSVAAGSEVAEAPVVASPAPVPAPVEDISPVTVVEEAVNAPTPVQVVDAAPTPVLVVDAAPTPVLVVDAAPTPVQVVDAAPTPVQVVDAAPTPVQVVDVAPEPVLVGEIVIPVAPVVTLPDTLN